MTAPTGTAHLEHPTRWVRAIWIDYRPDKGFVILPGEYNWIEEFSDFRAAVLAARDLGRSINGRILLTEEARAIVGSNVDVDTVMVGAACSP